jgi:hypothetical protein
LPRIETAPSPAKGALRRGKTSVAPRAQRGHYVYRHMSSVRLYERQGYQAFGRIECDPPGHTRI